MKLKTFIRLLILIAVIVGIYMIYNSSFFEGRPPTVEAYLFPNKNEHVKMPAQAYWNPDKNIEIHAGDESGIKNYKITAVTSDNVVVLDKDLEIVLGKPKEITFSLPKPEIKLPDGTKIHYKIAVTDWSNANFFSGNTTIKELDLTVDTQAPLVNIIANSYKISYGGSALLIFRVIDNSIQSIKVSNGENDFKVFPFVEEGVYAVILAWPVQNNFFNGTITVLDKAFNQKRVSIPLIKDMSVRYKYSNIKVKDNFLNGKLNELIDTVGERNPNDFKNNIEKFKYINETIRTSDEATIFKAATEVDYNKIYQPVDFVAFLPLKGSVVVGNFGDHRSYFLGKQKISKSLHLGLDIASTRNAPIIATNPGKVVLTDLLGVYGNTTIIYHGFGIASLYSHMSKFDLKLGEEVSAGTIIGLTGQTGWAFGDHLHLGILVQGYAVRDVEWMDPKWIKANITDVFMKAKNIIKAQSD
ncbi:M23 family metallopeptidase [Helicobacter sp. 11S03491-1]|uniref:M23 family metallopeptidase n=1 Tax=Helicobacter sp. 11S03491-1 TaxID=1476196 RepID=UPI0015DA83FD|nr:M23 family metallopeptidase [Helicobacter sp. 11S03491-1]